MKVDRSFFDKFNNSTYISNINELGTSIITEIHNILSTRLKSHINLNTFKSTEKSPFDYGIVDLQSFANLNQLSEHIKQCVLLNEPRIKDCHIENININNNKQSINFDILFIINNASECFQSNINIRY